VSYQIKRYVVWNPNSRRGDFEFLSSTQNHWTPSLQGAIKEAQDAVVEMQNNFEPPMSTKEALAELGGKPVVYELLITKVKY